MNISVLINNYNYGRFLGRAIQSAVAQTLSPLEIIVVDDGSTDDSLAVAHAWAARDARVKVIAQPNAGHLSAMNAGFQNSRGAIVCFLDADDEFHPGYLARLAEVYHQNPPVDFVFCRSEIKGENIARPPWEIPGGNFDYGITLCRAYLLRQWLGMPTSCLSARRTLLARFLPCPLESDWLNGADNVLVFGASLFLGRKYYLAEKWVDYHRHGKNDWKNGNTDPVASLSYQVRIARLLHHFTGGWDPTRNGGQDPGPMIVQEFKTIPQPRPAERRLYLRLIRKFARRERLKQWLRIWRLGWAARRNA
jgi:glycosyltransferase involved in cell wall biosynthesis